MAILSSTLSIFPTAAHATSDDTQVYKAGLVTLCSTDSYLRIGALNESPLPVTITASELSDQGKQVDLLGSNASDELRAIFPLVVPANSKYKVIWDLAVPAHVNGKEQSSDRWLHGSWLPKQWHDENGLDYKGTGGTAGKNGAECTIPSTTTTTAPSTTVTGTTDPSTTDPSTTGPTDELVPVTPASVWSTANSLTAANATDGDPSTEFVTQMLDWAPPTWAWLRADLGEKVPLRRIEWTWSETGAADQFTVEVSNPDGSWSTIAQPGDAPAGQWTGVTLERDARQVRLSWRNPNLDPQLGHLAEIRFLAAPGFEVDERRAAAGAASEAHTSSTGTVDDVVTPATKGDHYVVQSSARSSNAPDKSSRLPLDGDPATVWQTALTTPPASGWTMYDLGDVTPVALIKWKFSEIGHADNFLVQTSDDGHMWTTISTETNADEADHWQKLEVNVSIRFVRFFFTNPERDANIGFLSEVRFLPS